MQPPSFVDSFLRLGALARLASSIACCLVASPALASTWIVDQAGGPGSHFTDLPPAIAAAQSGDVLIVRPGGYSQFVLTEGLTILGDSPTTTWVKYVYLGSASIQDVPSTELVAIAGLRFDVPLRVERCDGPVLLDSLWAIWLDVDSCEDVRVRGWSPPSSGRGEIGVAASHVEIVSSKLIGESPGGYEGWDGTDGLAITSGSRVLFARSSARGGDGGESPLYYSSAGDGGHAVAIHGGNWILIAGGGVGVLQGGEGGHAHMGGDDGTPGWGLLNVMSGDWRSGVAISGGTGAPPIRYIPGPGSFDIAVVPDDPTLEMVGDPHPGASITLNVYAPPNSVVRLTLGGKPVVIATPNIRVEQLTTRDRSIFLGVVPASGVVSHVIQVPANYPAGAKLFAQARVVDFSIGEVRRTNSVAIIVR